MKAIVFDFDGTLTQGCSVWESAWKTLTYKVDKNSAFVTNYRDFLNKKMTYDELHQSTLNRFIKMDMNIADLDFIANKVKLIDGFSDAIKAIYDKGFSMHIVSGAITNIIERVIGKDLKYFSSINSHEMQFGDGYFLNDIVQTKYDFEGKFRFIEKLKKEEDIKSENIIFIGNSNNDESACKSGCRTICVNPYDTCYDNKEVWHEVIHNMTDLRQILPTIYKINEKIENNELMKNNNKEFEM